MYAFGLIYFIIGYLNYKRLFFTWYQTTFGFNEEFALYTLYIFKWGLLFHLLMMLMMYTNKRVLPPQEYNTDLHYRPLAQSFNMFVEGRFDNDYAMKLAIFVGVCIISYIIWRTIIKPIINIIKTKKE